MYKLNKNFDNEITSVSTRQGSTDFCIPFDPANTDYANFKREILADEAQLQDADGNLMSAQAAKQFVATLP